MKNRREGVRWRNLRLRLRSRLSEIAQYRATDVRGWSSLVGHMSSTRNLWGWSARQAMSQRYTILITDPEQRAALAAARSLARAGHRVITYGSSRGLAGWSRSVCAHVPSRPLRRDTLPDPADDVRSVVQSRSIDGIFPITDASCRWLLPLRPALDTIVIGPEAEAYDRASDKVKVTKAAETVGIRTPHQVVLCDPSMWRPELVTWQGVTVIKPARSAVLVNGVVERHGVQYVDGEPALSRVLPTLPESAFPLLLQERCSGEGAGVFLLRASGKTLMRFGHRRIREKPPSGGVSTCREAIEPPAELASCCELLLDALAYEGPAMIEFKRNTATGEWVLMEINARLWGSTQLAVDAGVDFPLGTLQWAFGDPVCTTMPKPGTRTTWELGELDHAVALAKGTPLSLRLPAGSPTGAGPAIRALLDRQRHERAEVLRLRDPMPFLVEAAHWFGGLLSRRGSNS